MVRELSYDYIVQTHQLVKNTMFSLPGYKTSAAEEQIQAYSTSNLFNHINNSERCNLIYFDNTVIGFLFAVVEKIDIYNVAYLEWNGVHPDYRKSGIMQKLWENFENWNTDKQLDGVLVDTLTSNIPMHRFLKKNKLSIWKQLNNHWYEHDYFLWGKLYSYTK